MKKKEKLKKKDIIFIVIAVLAGAILFYEIWFYYDATHNCIGCGRDNRCSQAHSCNCPDGESTCVCKYFDNNGEEKDGLKCPNNSINRINNN